MKDQAGFTCLASSIGGRYQRGRKFARLLILGFLALAALTAGTCAAQETRRYPMEPFAKWERGKFFSFVESSDTAFDKSAMSAYHRADPGNAYSKIISKMSLDELARRYVISYDNYESALLMLKVALLTHGGHLGPKQSQAMRLVVLFPDGHTERRDLDNGLLLDYAIERMYGDALKRRPSALRLNGRFQMSTQGTCDFAGGAVKAVTKGHFIEVTRGKALVAEGAAGRSKLFLLANEQKYVSIAGTKPRARIVVPDVVSELYEATVSNGHVYARGVVRGQCSFALLPR